MNLANKLRKPANTINDSITYKQKVWNGRIVGDWDKFWSSYSALRDSQEAIVQWKKIENPQRLELYGLLQALYVQQEAFRHVQEALGLIPLNIQKNYPNLEKIRIARHQLIGHPSQQTLPNSNKSYEDGTRTHTTIGYSDNSKVIEYVISSGAGSESKKLSLPNVIETQESILEEEIDKLIILVQKEDNEHKSTFEVGSLQKLLHTSTYLASKAYSFERDPEYARLSINSLHKIYLKFKEEICSRYKVDNLDDTIHVPGLVGELEKIDKVLPRVVKMLSNRENIDELDLDVYVESLHNSFRLLGKMAKEIDDEFAA